MEPEIKAQIDPTVYDDQVGIMEAVLEMDEIIDAVRKVREGD